MSALQYSNSSKYTTDGQIDKYFIDRKKVITDLFVMEMREI